MQTGTIPDRIREAGHRTNIVLPIAPEQVVVDDQRLRQWQAADLGVLTEAYPVKAKLNGDGEIVRIRTIEGNPYVLGGTLEIQYATPGDTVTWSANTISTDALTGCGVDLWVDGNDIDAFWVDADAITLKTSRSTDGGHTWGASSNVATVPGQGLGVTVQLCAPNADTLVYTDSTIGQDDDAEPLTALYIVLKTGGTWDTPILWDLGGQPLGVKDKVHLPNGNDYVANISGIVLADGRLELAYYGNTFRESYEGGLYVQRVGNLDYSQPTQHLHWAHPKEIYQSLELDNENFATQVFVSFPNLQVVGQEYWILCVETSRMADHERYYLSYFRSTDGLAWSDRYTNQGAANDDQVYAHCYDGDTPFLVNDLLYANLVVTDERTFIVSYDKVFFCPSTTLVGVTNPARQLDITDYITDYTVSRPTAPTVGSTSYNMMNLPKNWNGDDLLTAHRGVRLLHRAGYYTDIYHGDELIDIGQYWIDNIQQSSVIGSEAGSVQGLDNMMLMERWKSDIYHEFFGPQQMAFDLFCDLIPFTVIHGSFTTGGGGRLKSGVVKKSDNFRDNIAVLNPETNALSDGFFTYHRVRCDTLWANNHMGFAFQGRAKGDEDDNKRFWAVLYGRTPNRFTLNEAIPRPNPNRNKLYKYRSFVAQSDEIELDFGRWYWVRVANWHSHVMVWYTTDTDATPDPNWILVLDFTSAATPVNQVLPCRIGWQGLIGTKRINPSGAVGNLNSSGGMQDLMDGGGNPYMVALLVQLADDPSELRRVNLVLTQENEDGTPMPDVTALVLDGDATEPFDATDEDNVIFSRDGSALLFGTHDSPAWNGANPAMNPMRPKIQSSAYLWVAVTFDGVLGAGQSYKWASGGTGTCKISSDGGATWSDAPAVMTASVEVEYMAGRVKYNKMYYATAENTNTYEELSHQISAKSGVLNLSPLDFVAQADMSLGADNIFWQPEGYGKISDMAAEADVEIEIYGTARFMFGSTVIDAGDNNGFVVELSADDQTIAFYKYGVLVSVSESLQFIPTSFHIQFANQNSFIYVYINECLASVWHDQDYTVAGYVGIDSIGATWTNFRVPDLYQIVDYWSLDAKETASSNLQRLVAKPAPGVASRVKYFVRYDGSLRIGSFRRRALADTFEDIILSSNKQETGQYVVTVVSPSGEYYALRSDPQGLDSDGRWYDERDYTDARSDIDAYIAALSEFYDMREKANTISVDTKPVWVTEQEDLNLLTNPADKTSGLYIVNDTSITYEPKNPASVKQTTGYRLWGGNE